jgi:hypothetical protein
MKDLDVNVDTDTDMDETRVHVNIKNPITGADNYVTIVLNREGVIVDVWGDEHHGGPIASMYQHWSDLADENDETDNKKEIT